MLVDTKSHNAQLDVTLRVFLPPSLSLALCLALPVSFWWGPINFIAHLIDRKNYSFISTKIAKSAQNQLATTLWAPFRLRAKERKKIAKVCDDSAAISIKYA